MRAKNSLVYANYYLLHEKNYKHYIDYKLLYDKELLTRKDDNISQLRVELFDINVSTNEKSGNKLII